MHQGGHFRHTPRNRIVGGAWRLNTDKPEPLFFVRNSLHVQGMEFLAVLEGCWVLHAPEYRLLT